jgi:hypothetical protein
MLKVNGGQRANSITDDDMISSLHAGLKQVQLVITYRHSKLISGVAKTGRELQGRSIPYATRTILTAR